MPVYVHAAPSQPRDGYSFSQGAITVCQPLSSEEAVFAEAIGPASWRVSWPNDAMRRNLIISFKRMPTGNYTVIKVDPSSERKSYTIARLSLDSENSYDLNGLLEQVNQSIQTILEM